MNKISLITIILNYFVLIMMILQNTIFDNYLEFVIPKSKAAFRGKPITARTYILGRAVRYSILQ